MRDAERITKLETALKELAGFAARNAMRAEAAWRSAYAALPAPYLTSGTPQEAELAASSRLHEANRVLAVVRDRVKEALTP